MINKWKKRRFSGFTLVEMLMVITVIGILMGLLSVGVIGIRHRARLTQCQSNIHNVSVAVLNYNANTRFFPYYRESFPGGKDGSWIVAILYALDQKPLGDAWLEPSAERVKRGDIPTLRCPSNSLTATPSPGVYGNSYVANCGLNTKTSDDNKATMADCGVFVDGLTGKRVLRNSLERITALDGTTYTLMLSENNQASQWVYETDVAPTQPYEIGMQWFVTPSECQQLNRCFADKAIGSNYARPSSYHEGGVNVIFCDGHAAFLSMDVNYTIYCQIMAPNDNAASAYRGDLRNALDTSVLGK